jgi:hypothetical protein
MICGENSKIVLFSTKYIRRSLKMRAKVVELVNTRSDILYRLNELTHDRFHYM